VLAPALHQPARVQVAAAGQGDEPLGERPQLLGLRLRGDNPVVLEEAGREVIERRLAVARRARELAVLGAVPHYSSPPSLGCATGGVHSFLVLRSPFQSAAR